MQDGEEYVRKRIRKLVEVIKKMKPSLAIVIGPSEIQFWEQSGEWFQNWTSAKRGLNSEREAKGNFAAHLELQA